MKNKTEDINYYLREQLDWIIENEQNSPWETSSSMEDLWSGHILMVIHLHGNADLFKLHAGRLELLDTDAMLVGQMQGNSLYSVLSSYQMQIAFIFTVSQSGWVYRILWVMLFSIKFINVHALSCTYIHNLSSTYT